MLALPLSFGGPAEVLSGFSLVPGVRLEPAGRAFHAKALSTVGERRRSVEERSFDSTPTSDDHVFEKCTRDKARAQIGASKLKEVVDREETLYETLEVDPTSTMDDIRRAYRRLALKYHPDKQDGSEDEELKQKFLAIQLAYEWLSDIATRKQYDSNLPFDEAMPKVKTINDSTFFDIFGPLFDSNARFSVYRPVPSLGTEESTIEETKKFYDFWMMFQSWRDFSIHDEYDLTEAECREERRWMELENKAIRQKYEKAEHARVRKLVDLAHKMDPRIRKQKAEEAARLRAIKEARQREAEDRQQKEKRAIEEKKRAEVEARQQALAAEREKRQVAALKAQEGAKLTERAEAVRGAFLTADELHPVDLESMFRFLGREEALEFAVELEKQAEKLGVETVFHVLKDRVDQIKNQLEEEKRQRAEEFRRKHAVGGNKELESRRVQASDEWTPAELALLAKGFSKFPGGTPNRWKLVANMIRTKTVEDVIKKSRQLSEGSSLKAVSAKLSKNTMQQFVEENKNSLKKIDSPLDVRGVAENDDGWSAEQQAALVKALQKFPNTMPAKERWQSIGKEVAGKTSKECLAKFKSIREKLIQAKAS